MNCISIKKSDGSVCGRELKDGKCRYHGVQKKSDIINIVSEVPPAMSPTDKINDDQTAIHSYYPDESTNDQKVIKCSFKYDDGRVCDYDMTRTGKCLYTNHAPAAPKQEVNMVSQLMYQYNKPSTSFTAATTISSSHDIDHKIQLEDYCSNHSIRITRKMQDDEKSYVVLGAHMLLRVSVDSKMLFMWPTSEKKAIDLIRHINSIGLEAHEIILIDHCRMFMDIDIILSSKQYKIQLNKFESEDHLTGEIINAYEQACDLSIKAHGHKQDLIYYSATRIRPIEGDMVKVGIHIVSDAWMPISHAKYIANDMRKQLKFVNTDLSSQMLIDGIDTQPYRMRGSLSLPGGTKNGIMLMPNDDNIMKYFISRNDEHTTMINQLDIKLVEYQPHEINNEFIKEALNNVESIPDWSDAFDLDSSSLKGSTMIVRRVRPSYCSVCDREHQADNTLRLTFNANAAFWKCSHAPEGTKSKLWYENKEAKSKVSHVGSKPIDILRAQLLDICKDRYRRVEQTGAIYERKYDYYYTHKFDAPEPFLTHIFRNNEMYSTSGSSVHKELLYFIKHIVHPDFEFVKHDMNYIGFTNGVYDLSTATFIPADQLDKTIQVRKLFNQEYKITSTPLLDMYFKYQFHEDDIEFIYFLLGRTMSRLDDHFDFMILLYGQGGSGKSLLAKLISLCFAPSQVGILSSSFQGQFGLAEFATREIVVSDDMPSNLAKTLDKGDFLKMMTRGAISCPIKQKQACIEVHDWNIPTIINSNSLPNYKDESGEIVRRIMVMNFENVIPEAERNTNLESDITKNEMSTFIHKCRSTYLEYKTRYHGKGVETFCPQVFLDNRRLLRLSVNNTCAFINERFEYSENEKDTMSLPELNKLFKLWMVDRYSLQKKPKESINAQSIESIDSRIKYRKIKLCKHCSHEHKKNCCSKYSRDDRTSQDRVYNIKFKSMDDISECEAFQRG